MRHLPAIIAPLALALLAYVLNLTQTLGAHPWWSVTVLLIGVPIGVVLGAGLGMAGLSRIAGLALTGAATALAFGAAHFGKTRFAASFAEDQLAGQVWYFGWIATCGLAAALVVMALWPQRRGN